MDCNWHVWMMLPFWEASPELMPWVCPHCWARLVGISGIEKIYLDSTIIKKLYPSLSTTIGGQGGMDYSRRFWMMYSIYRACYQQWCFIAVGRI